MSGCKSSRATQSIPSANGSGIVSQSPGSSVRTVDYERMRQEIKGMAFDSDVAAMLVTEAACWIGTPYLYAGHTLAGTDCSGMVMEVYRSVLDVLLPRNSAQQQAFCQPLSVDEMLPGDLVFFATGANRDRVSHVGLYIGGRRMIHASSSRGVIVSPVDDPYFGARFHSAGRVPAVATASQKKQQPESAQPQVQVPPQTTLPTAEPISVDALIEQKLDSIFTDFLD